MLREGKRFNAEQYSLIVLENNLGYPRFALSIKKIIGNAVRRNYEKRLCREFFRREILGKKKGFDVLIIIKDKSESYRKSFDKLKELFNRAVNFRL